MRLMLGTIAMFDAVLVALVGIVALFYVDAPAGRLIGAACFVAAGTLVALSHHLDRPNRWR
jgi:hypothetical protein